jgi:carbon-monoxide dehydrogenase small subunit
VFGIMGMHDLTLTVNGVTKALTIESRESLSAVLRERLGLTGTKVGCGSGACGSCAVLIDGKLTNSCLQLAALLNGKSVLTIEGLEKAEDLSPVQQAFVDSGAIQCGFCTPGMIMASVALLSEKEDPSESEIKEAISGNICRCTGYTKIIKAIRRAAKSQMQEA